MTRTQLRAEALEDRLTPVTLPIGFAESVFASGFTNPTAMAVAPDGRVFVAEQGGALRVVQNGTTLATPFVSLTVDSAVERGLLGVTVDPNFAANRFVYVYYTVPATGATAAFNRVSRFTANGNVAAAGSQQTILDLDPLTSAQVHNGGAIQFGPDGKLYVAVGDAGNSANAQSLANRFGKILRINADGSIPVDNPTTIAGLGTVPAGTSRMIWAAGLRNPFTFAFEPGTGKMFINDVGQSSFEEIDRGQAGANYGWPMTEGTFDQALYPSSTQPVYAYPHTGTHPFRGTAVVGGAFAPSSFPASYAGDYFFADLSDGWINVLDATTGTVANFADQPTGGGAIVGLAAGPSGQLLYLSRDPQGTIYQITHSVLTGTAAAGAGKGGGPVAKLIDLATGTPRVAVAAFPAGFTGGVRVATADVTNDGTADLVAGAGPGGGPDVRVFDGVTGQQVRQVFPFEMTFTGGVYVASADLDNDGFADLIVSPDVGGGPRVRVLSGKDGSQLANFFGIDDAKFRGGVRVTAGDLNGDGTPDLVVAAGAGGGPRVAVFDGTSLRPGVTPVRLMNDFFAFEPALRDGTFVAAGDTDGDGRADLVVGAGPGGAPRVVVFNGVQLLQSGAANALAASFFVGDPTGRGGVPVAVRNADADSKAEVLAGAVAGGLPRIGVYKVSGGTATKLSDVPAFEDAFKGGVFVG
ncbi:MAG: PQQ-dependent sugar dehydrogenase [Gemmataceae bacterium]|nr:PQQ-dependent sugar dehydrogenase [Gemmataceae bacterium]